MSKQVIVTRGIFFWQVARRINALLLVNFKSDIKQKGIKILMSNLKAVLSSLRARPQHVIVHIHAKVQRNRQ